MRGALLVLALAACQKSADQAPTAPSREIAFPGATPLVARPVPARERGTVVTVLDPGREPRSVLRYHGGVGSSVSFSVHYAIDSSFTSSEEPAAKVSQGTFDLDFEMTLTITSLDADGNFRVEGRAQKLAFTPRDEIARQAMSMFRGEKETVVTATLTASGETLELDAGRTVISQYVNPRAMFIPLPLAPVGPGARWRAIQRYEAPYDFIDDAEVTLLSSDGNRARIALRSTWHQPNRRMRSPEADMAVKLDGESSWQEASLRLDGPPVVESGNSSMVVRFPLEPGGGSVRIVATVVLKALP